MDYQHPELSEYFSQAHKVHSSTQCPGAWSSTAHQEDAARLPLKTSGCRPVRYTEPVQRPLEPSFPGSSTPKLGAPSKSKVANNMAPVPILRNQLDVKKFPALQYPWQWAYVPSSTTTDPSAKVLVPVNKETQAIRPSYYNRVPSGSTGQLKSISVGESAFSTPKPDPSKTTKSAAESKKDSPSKSVHTMFGACCLSRPSNKSLEERFNVMLDPACVTKPPSSPGGSLRHPGAYAHMDAETRLDARTETLFRKAQQIAWSDKELAELDAIQERKQQASGEITKKTRIERQRVDPQKLADAIKASGGLLSDEDVAFTFMYPGIPLPNVRPRPASKSAAQIVEENLKSALPVPTAARTSTQSAREKKILADMIDPQKSNDVQTIKRVEESLKKVLGVSPTQPTTENKTPAQAVNAQKMVPKTTHVEDACDKLAEQGIAARNKQQVETGRAAQAVATQAASDNKREKWLAVDKPKILQEEFEQLSLELDEEGWEKVDGDEEWEVVDDPNV
ncbi:hypothetical protein G6011_05910 [Alternaria panax]|uniref:Uncharacterized protein n=1 Tax=Alternaria panax TaxID=48097 RepID=A0AAD4I7Q9_9PLEO|nr:hypothetical protein G6011_05910 [Alternaria panax]